jgi:pyruvate/2-oxoglutarate dehydrogenase complex dihydrolipoamide dehydrogenase (E3) component
MKFDAIVIGSGQAGNPLSYALAERGWSVALVEESQLGGTCVNTGCTPTKTLVASAQVAHYARNAARWGVRASDVSADLAAILTRKNRVVQNMRSGLERRVAAHATMRLFRGHARFADARTVEVAGEQLASDKIFIDTGARAAIPTIPGLESAGYLTNASIMELDQLPQHLLILGGGYIGLEFGQIFARFGSRVTIVHRNTQILSREDPEIAAELQKALEAEGVRFVLEAKTVGVERRNNSIGLAVETLRGAEKLSGSHLLVATGRKPNTDDLALDRAGIAADEAGYIRVNGRLETNVPGIWALGDVKGGPAFTHIAYNDYQIVWANLIEGKNQSIENRYLPYAVFTDPQLGRVGLTEKYAHARGFRLKIGKVSMSHVARAIERDETAGLMKIVVDAANDRILGASILASEGGELVQLLGVAMLANAPYTLLKGAVYIHPTLVEGFWALMESVKPAD